jgi:hypothetical protein
MRIKHTNQRGQDVTHLMNLHGWVNSINQFFGLVIIVGWVIIALGVYLNVMFHERFAVDLLPGTGTLVRVFLISCGVNLIIEVVLAYIESMIDFRNFMEKAFLDFLDSAILAGRNIFATGLVLIGLTLLLNSFLMLFYPRQPGDVVGERPWLNVQIIFIGIVVGIIWAVFYVLAKVAKESEIPE